METIEQDDWKIIRTPKDEMYIYEFFHKPLEHILPMGRYIKYIQDGEEIIIIEDGPYLGQV